MPPRIPSAPNQVLEVPSTTTQRGNDGNKNIRKAFQVVDHARTCHHARDLFRAGQGRYPDGLQANVPMTSDSWKAPLRDAKATTHLFPKPHQVGLAERSPSTNQEGRQNVAALYSRHIAPVVRMLEPPRKIEDAVILLGVQKRAQILPNMDSSSTYFVSPCFMLLQVVYMYSSETFCLLHQTRQTNFMHFLTESKPLNQGSGYVGPFLLDRHTSISEKLFYCILASLPPTPRLPTLGTTDILANSIHHKRIRTTNTVQRSIPPRYICFRQPPCVQIKAIPAAAVPVGIIFSPQRSTHRIPLSANSSRRTTPPIGSHLFPTRDMADQSRSTSFRARFDSALQTYQQTTGETLAEHPLTVQLQNPHSIVCSIENITVILQYEARASNDRLRTARIMQSIESTVSLLFTLSSTTSFGDAIGVRRPR